MASKGRRARERGQRENAWSGRIQEWRSSGQTQVRFCAERGLSVWMLRKWIVKLGGRPRQAALELLPIPISALRPASGVSATSEAALEIALPNGVRVRASGAIAGELTRALARTLRCSTRC